MESHTATARDSETQTVLTPPVSTYEECPHDIGESSIPTAGCTYIIVSAFDGRAITLLDRKIKLERIGGPGQHDRWECVEKDGWLGFRDRSSLRYLGRGSQSLFQCEVTHHKGWESYCIRHTSRNGGGYVLLQPDWWTLRPVVVTGEPKQWLTLAPSGSGSDIGEVWRFIKVPSAASTLS